jgi:hypothetical protein
MNDEILLGIVFAVLIGVVLGLALGGLVVWAISYIGRWLSLELRTAWQNGAYWVADAVDNYDISLEADKANPYRYENRADKTKENE